MSIAFLFPGQGSQTVGMLSGLLENPEYADIVTQTFAEASNALGFDLWEMVSNGPADALNQTHNTQPAMLAAGVTMWRIWQHKAGPAPAVMAGHSLGEYTALVCAGALDFADAIKLVATRGRLMQEAVPAGTGAMAAILGLDDDSVKQICLEESSNTGKVAQAVNFNSPGQVVVAGNSEAIDLVIERAGEAGAKKAIKLPVSVPSHCELMKPAADKLAEELAAISINTPEIPVINNVDVCSESDPDAIRQALVKQLYNPVRWVETINTMVDSGVEQVVECGPGKVLAGLNKRINRRMPAHPIFDADTVAAALEKLSA